MAAFQIKSYSLPQHLVSDLLACHEAKRASLDLVTVVVEVVVVVVVVVVVRGNIY